jgi:hypothetical protein
MDLSEIGWGSVEWIQLAQDRDRWRDVVNAVMNLRALVPASIDSRREDKGSHALNFTMKKAVLGCYRRSQIFKTSPVFKVSVTYLYSMTRRWFPANRRRSTSFTSERFIRIHKRDDASVRSFLVLADVQLTNCSAQASRAALATNGTRFRPRTFTLQESDCSSRAVN